MTALEGSAVVVAKVPRALQGWRPELAYGLYLARRAGTWSAGRHYARADFVKTRFVLPLALIAEIDEIKATSGLPRYLVLTEALYQLSRDRLAGPPAQGRARALGMGLRAGS